MQITSRTRLQSRLQHGVFIILLVIIAGLIAWLSTRYDMQADWTHSNRHTLSQASQKLLAELSGPIMITIYASKDEQIRKPIKELIQRYQKHKTDISLRFVDPYTVPDEVRSKGIQLDGELVIDYQGRTEQVRKMPLSESDISTALQRLARSDNQLVAFLTGHGERSPTDFSDHDLSNWSQELKQRGFEVQPLNFGQNTLPFEEIKVLVIASPQSQLLPGETALIAEYIDQGGNLLWLLDSDDLLGLEPLAEQLGLKTQPGILVDPDSRLFGVDNPAFIAIATSGYGYHPVTEGLENYVTLFPQTTGLVVEPPTEDWEKAPLLTTITPRIWSETSAIQDQDTVEYNEETDIDGPFDIAFALTRDKTEENTIAPSDSENNNEVIETSEEFGNEVTNNQSTVEAETDLAELDDDTENEALQQRVIIVGDGDFLSNGVLGYGGNLELALKMINWLSQDDNLIQIPAKTTLDLKLELSADTVIFLGVFFLLLLPLTLISIGISIWSRRRKA